MAIKALNPFEPTWYTPKSEQGQDNPTRFRIRGLDGQQKSYVAAEFQTDDHGVMKNLARGIDLALQYGLLDWENLANDKGPVKFSPANFRLLPAELREELALEIWNLSAPTEDARKNS